ncbi:unnamed protein product [Ixodes hexagonus]
MNVRSMQSKNDDIEILFDTLRFSFSVPMFTETWYTPHSHDFVLPNYQHFSIRRNAREGGGVSMLVDQSLNSCLIPDFTEMSESFELLSIQCGIYVFSVLYRPPSGNVNTLLLVLDKLLIYVGDNNLTLFLGEDFNIDLLETSTARNDLYSIVESSGLECVATGATRITDKGSTLLDYFITNCFYDDISSSGVISCNISDHLPIFLLTNKHCPNKRRKREGFKLRTITLQRLQLFINAIETSNWDLVYANDFPDIAYKVFLETFHHIYNNNFPYKFIKPGKKAKKPWVSQDVLKRIEMKNYLYYIFVKSKDSDDLAKFKVYRNKLNALTKKAKLDFYNNMFGNIQKHETDKIWKNVNRVLKPHDQKTIKTNLFIVGKNCLVQILRILLMTT